MKLPIDVKPNTYPPIFLWKKEIDTVNGKEEIPFVGILPSICEDNVRLLIEIAKKQCSELFSLKSDMLSLKKDNEALQALLLSAEKTIEELNKLNELKEVKIPKQSIKSK